MDKKQVKKYSVIYMSIGMCFGVSFGTSMGMIFGSDNLSIGMCLGLSIGMCIGLAVGSAKDKRISENMMEISKIETMNEADAMIYAIDKNGIEKEYRVSEKKMKEESFLVGDRVAEETDGSLISLENR